MLQILSFGSSFPENEVKTNELSQLFTVTEGDTLEVSAGFACPQQRFWALSRDYIKDTQNRDVFQSQPALLSTPSDVALKAVQIALSRAKISAEQIGMVVGATQTPLQTTPFESQRVAKMLGLKVPAFDIQSGAADILCQILLLSRWKKESLPEYILCVSSSAASMHLDYSAGTERYFFGDGASVAVLSPSTQGIIEVIGGSRSQDISSFDCIDVDMLGHIRGDIGKFIEFCRAHDEALTAQREDSEVFVPALDNKDFYQNHGYLLGAHTSANLEWLLYNQEGSIEKNDRIAVSLAGTGGGMGCMSLRVREFPLNSERN